MVDSLETKVGRLEDKVARIESILDGRPGEKGLKQAFTDFFSAYRQREEDKRIYDDRQERKLDRQAQKQNLMIGILTVVGLIGSLLIGILTYEHEMHKAFFDSANPTYSEAETSTAR